VKLDRLLRYPKLAGDLHNASLFGHKVFQDSLLAIGKGRLPTTRSPPTEQTHRLKSSGAASGVAGVRLPVSRVTPTQLIDWSSGAAPLDKGLGDPFAGTSAAEKLGEGCGSQPLQGIAINRARTAWL